MLLPRAGATAHTFQKAMALKIGIFTMVNVQGFASSLERAIRCKCPPKRRLKGPLEPERLRAVGNCTGGFTPPRMFLASATATAPGAGSIR